MLSFLHITRNTLRECLRDPLYAILLISALTIIGLFPNLSFFVFSQQTKLIIDSSLSTTMVFGFAISVLCASQTISREIKEGTVFLLLSKPIMRWKFILAKEAGIIISLIIFFICCSSATLIAIKIGKDQFKINWILSIIYFVMITFSSVAGGIRNYISGSSFASTTVTFIAILLPILTIIIQVTPFIETPKNAPEVSNILKAQLLILFSIVTIGAITTTISTKLAMFQTLIFSAIIFMLGLTNGYIFSILSPINYYFAVLFKTLIPNWQYFWLVDALGSKIDIPIRYIQYGFIYMIFYLSLCTLWSIYIFRKREIAL